MKVTRAEHCGTWYIQLDGTETLKLRDLGDKNVLTINGHAAPNTMRIRFTDEQLESLLEQLLKRRGPEDGKPDRVEVA